MFPAHGMRTRLRDAAVSEPENRGDGIVSVMERVFVGRESAASGSGKRSWFEEKKVHVVVQARACLNKVSSAAPVAVFRSSAEEWRRGDVSVLKPPSFHVLRINVVQVVLCPLLDRHFVMCIGLVE